MNKKLHLFCLALVATVFFKTQAQTVNGTCGTPAPSQQWESWFSSEVEKFKELYKSGQARLVKYDIPVIVHIIHAGETVGTFPNIDSNQVKTQIIVMNQDFAGTGLSSYTTPPAFAGLVANTGIKFCRAKTNPAGTALTEIGIDRVNVVSNGWTNPNTATLNLQNYLNTVIIPATIWDPTKYLNIWISARPSTMTVNGFATYPAGTTLPGLFNGNMGTGTNDGIWVWTKAFGTTGSATAPYNGGRTAVHELGHWLGLRHIWGDGNCLSDYCNDTPASKGPHYGSWNYTNTPIDACGVNQAPNREMPMNFMDMTDDADKWMFTTDQNVRIQVSMSQCSNRNVLGTHGLCTATPVPVSSSSAIASFVTSTIQCLGSAFTPFNTSSGYPYPTYVWSSSPAASFSPATTVANPGITLTNPGTYTITLVATNSVSSSSYSMLVNATFTCPPGTTCLDTLRMIRNVDTLKTFYAPTSSITLGCQSTGFKGYLVGTNCYQDKEFAQYFSPNTYTATTFPQVNSVIVLFDSIGTKATNVATQIKCKVYGGTSGYGPGAVLNYKSDSLGKIVASTKATSVAIIGKPYIAPVQANTLIATKIIPFKFDMPTPVIINSASGFFAGIEGPLPNTGDSVNIFSDSRSVPLNADSSAWYFGSNLTWRNYKSGRGYRIRLAIIPQITCSPINGLKEYQNSFMANVNVVPNPNNGLFSFIFTLKESKEIEIAIFNSLGQEVSVDRLTNVSNNVINVDMSNQPKGVYFAQVSNGREKVVKKIILTN